MAFTLPKRMMTQRQIAKSLGVSCATVANILSGKPGLRYSQQTRDRVTAAAAEMGYQQNRASRVIRTGRSNLIGIVHFGSDIEAVRKCNQLLARYSNIAGYDYLAVDMSWHEGCVDRTVNELVQARVEGVLTSHVSEIFLERHIEVLTRAGIPLVSVNGEEPAQGSLSSQKVGVICHNVEDAFYGLTQHLIALGHRRILHLCAASSTTVDDGCHRWASERMRGFQRAIEEHGEWKMMEDEAFFSIWPDGAGGAEGVRGFGITRGEHYDTLLDSPQYILCKRLFATGVLPDAIVCTNDMYAIEVIITAMEHGIRVPGDLAVTGYDNDRIGGYPAFGLTTAEQDIDGICAAAVKSLVQRIKDPRKELVRQKFNSKLVLRSSCGGEKRSHRVGDTGAAAIPYRRAVL